MDDNPGNSLFQPGSINVENPLQNQEEAEDIEDQKRRQEEIQHLLTAALDDFNYDDQSTMNSSSNVSLEDSKPNSLHLSNKYRDVSIDDQLRVLYEVRVREVKKLTEQIGFLQIENQRQKDDLNKKYFISEAGREKAELTLNQAQTILVNKTEEINNLKGEVNNTKSTIDSLKKQLDHIVDESKALKHVNQDLMDQITLSKVNYNSNDRLLDDNHRVEVQQLRNSLENLNMRLERKENEQQEMEHKLRSVIKEKDEFMIEKSGQINLLTEHLESAQSQCRELINVIEKLSEENGRSKRNNTSLTDSMKFMGLKDQTDMINALHKELEKSKDLQKKQLLQFEQFQKQYSENVIGYNKLQSELEICKIELEERKEKQENVKLSPKSPVVKESLYKAEVKALERENKLLTDKMCNLYEEIEKLKRFETNSISLQKEIIVLKEQLKLIQEMNTNQLNSTFPSDYYTLQIDKEKLEENLEQANHNVIQLENKLIDREHIVKNLETKIVLQQERETLIQALQEKAAQFEEYLKKQEKIQVKSVASNTENNIKQDSNELLIEKYEADLIQKEIILREEIQKEFSDKFLKYQQENAIKSQIKIEDCSDCKINVKKSQELQNTVYKLAQQLKTNDEQRFEDRQAVATMMENWREKFGELEAYNQEISGKFVISQRNCATLAEKLKIRERGDRELYEKVKSEVEVAVNTHGKRISEETAKVLQKQRDTVEKVGRRIDEIHIKAEKEIIQIENDFKKNIKAFCKKQQGT